VILINGDIGIIEQFYKFDSESYAVIQILKQTPYNFTIAQATPDLALALLKINESIFFCNLTDTRIFINVNKIKEKVILIESSLNPKTTFFVTKVVVRHN
jgi:hypothetical protein